MNHEDCLGTNRECSFDGGHTTHQNASGVSILLILLLLLIIIINIIPVLISILSINIHSHRITKSHDQTYEWASASASRVLCNWGQILPANEKVSLIIKMVRDGLVVRLSDMIYDIHSFVWLLLLMVIWILI